MNEPPLGRVFYRDQEAMAVLSNALGRPLSGPTPGAT